MESYFILSGEAQKAIGQVELQILGHAYLAFLTASRQRGERGEEGRFGKGSIFKDRT
jgi:hypothetical protein